MNCLFCSISQGNIPANKVYEDENVLAFLDIHPVNPGHVLIIPKSHHENFVQTPDDVMSQVMTVARSCAKALLELDEYDGVNIGINNGAAAGQVIFHTHVHVMPRNETDGHTLWHGKEYENNEAMQAMANRIKDKLHNT